MFLSITKILLATAVLVVSKVCLSYQLSYNLIGEKMAKISGHLQTQNHKALVLRLPSNNLLQFTSYKDISILHFRMPFDTRNASFYFKAFEESKSSYPRKCKPQNVTLHLKANSLPVIGPENITLPKQFLSPNERFQIRSINFKSNDVGQYIDVRGPQIGNWFAVAYVSWMNPNDKPIQPQGLAASCETILLAELSVTRFYPTIINSGQKHKGSLTNKLFQPDNLNQRGKIFHDIYSAKQNEVIYKFFVPTEINVIAFSLTFDQVCKNCSEVSLHVQANALPSSDKRKTTHIKTISINTDIKEEANFEIDVQPDTWHYAFLAFGAATLDRDLNRNNFPVELKENSLTLNQDIQYSIQIDYQEQMKNDQFELQKVFFNNLTKKICLDALNSNTGPSGFIRKILYYPLLRQTYDEFFTFDFDLFPDVNGTTPTTLNLTAGVPVGLAVDLEDMFDIGGTLTFAVSWKHETKALRELQPDATSKGLIKSDGFVNKTTRESNAREDKNKFIIVCMHLGEPGIPTWPDKCRFGNQLLPAHIIINNTAISSSMGLIHVPFPESGRWYITMSLYCFNEKSNMTSEESVKEFVSKYASVLGKMRTFCNCYELFNFCVNNNSCLANMSETDLFKMKECMLDINCTPKYIEMAHLFELRYASVDEQLYDTCNASIVFSATSSPCVEGRCSRFGHCYHYMSGGFVFSTCVCDKGYRGWDCSDDSHVPPKTFLLLALLLLTLSNLVLFPSIYIAVRRKYVTEAIIYFFVMLFSVFYHACDSGEEEYSFCLVKIEVLQFCDFYCSLLAIWVTLVAMANIPCQWVSLLHMMGAIVLAFGTKLNKENIFLFLTPAVIGISLISISWGFRCYKTKSCYPKRRYFCVYIPIGAILVMIGLVCFAFLETKANYHIVHSIWHMVMALSIICLLPCRKSFSKTG